MTGEEIAQALRVHYDGVQPGWHGFPDTWQFTDLVTGNTFHANGLEEARRKLEDTRRVFKMESCRISKYNETDLEQVTSRLAINPADYPGLLEGMNTELEHCDFTDGDPTLSARIALAHLKETPDYYKKLKEAGL